jgi:hypothetical protein
LLPISGRLVLKIDAGKFLPGVIFHNKACGLFFDETVVGAVCLENNFLRSDLQLEPNLKKVGVMTRVLLVGYDPETADYSNPCSSAGYER